MTEQQQDALWATIVDLAKASIPDPSLHEYLHIPNHPPVQEGILTDFVWTPLYWHTPDTMPVLIFPEPEPPAQDEINGGWLPPTRVRFYPSTADVHDGSVVPVALGLGTYSAVDAMKQAGEELDKLVGPLSAGKL